MLKSGFQFAPGYRLQEFLGRGQFGQVWRATAPGGAAAAVKFIDLSDGQGQKEYDGVRRVKQIRHANLMPITAIWLLDGQGQVIEEAPDEAQETIDLSVAEGKGQSGVFVPVPVAPSWLAVSMLLGGQSLQSRLRECIESGLPGVPPKELISYMDESAKGVDFLNAPQHDLGDGPIAIQHSDIKPANIVLIGSSAVVCDFGLARILTRNQVTATSAAGTPAYMAPEAISGKPSRTSDQYALAVTYYHLRTGTLPVGDSSLWEVLDAHRQGKLKFDHVSPAEREVLKKATSMKWGDRFESCVDMVDALRDALRNEGQTKPSFVSSIKPDPNAPVRSADTPILATAELEEDPTATFEFSSEPGQPVETGFALPPESADQSVLMPTVADEELDEDSDDAQSRLVSSPLTVASSMDASLAEAGTNAPPAGFVQQVLEAPKWMLGSAVAIPLLAILSLMFWPSAGTENDGDPPVVVDPVPEDDPVVQETGSLDDAYQLLAEDESKAVRIFDQAYDQGDIGSLPMIADSWATHSGEVRMMAASGGYLASIADKPIVQLNALVPTATSQVLAGHELFMNVIETSPDGRRLVTGGFDSVPRLWDLSADDVAASMVPINGHRGEIKAAVFHPTKPIVVTASADEKIGVWKLGFAESQNTRSIQPAQYGVISNSTPFFVKRTIHSLAIDEESQWLFATASGTDNEATVADAIAMKWAAVESTLDDPASPSMIVIQADIAKRIAVVSPGADGFARAVVGSRGGSVSLFAMQDPPALVDRAKDAHFGDVEAMRTIRLNGRDVIVTGAADGSIHYWSIGSINRSERLIVTDKSVFCVDVSADGRWVAAGCEDGTAWLWDAQSATKKLATRWVSGAGSVDSILFDPDGKHLIVGQGNGTISRLDLTTLKLLALARPTPLDQTIDSTKTIDLRQLSRR